MKNNLLALKSCDVDERLPTHNDFLDLIITNKIDDGEFFDVLSQITESLQPDLNYIDDDDVDEDYYMDEDTFPERLLNSENQPNLLYAGYTDCMDEAIRFLIEEENISPENPVIINLKAHLEKSKERVLQAFEDYEYSNLQLQTLKTSNTDDSIQKISPLASIYMESFQSCRGSV